MIKEASAPLAPLPSKDHTAGVELSADSRQPARCSTAVLGAPAASQTTQNAGIPEAEITQSLASSKGIFTFFYIKPYVQSQRRDLGLRRSR